MLMTRIRPKPPTLASRPPPSSSNKAINKAICQASVPQKSKITVPVQFNLITSKRIQERPARVQSTSPFRATPIPTPSLRPCSGKGPSIKTRRELTVPITPKLHKTIPRRTVLTESHPDHFTTFQPRPVPKTKPFIPLFEHHTSKSLPMTLPGDKVAEEKRKRFQEALERERIQAEEARQFHARPAPKFPKDSSVVV